MIWNVVSVNVQHGGAKDNNFDADWRWPGIAELIRAQDPNLVLMQETGPWLENRRTVQAQVERDLRMRVHVVPGKTGGSAAVAHRHDTPWIAREERHAGVIHALCHVTLDIGAEWPLTVESVHLTPFSAQDAAIEMQRCVARLYRYGGIGIMGGDINHVPLGDPEPDWSKVDPFNRSSRTIDNPPRGNTIVAEVAAQASLIEVGGYLADSWGHPEMREPTGHAGRVRVDQFHVTPAVRPALVDYYRVPTGRHTDHDMIVMRIDLDKIDRSLAFEAS